MSALSDSDSSKNPGLSGWLPLAGIPVLIGLYFVVIAVTDAEMGPLGVMYWLLLSFWSLSAVLYGVRHSYAYRPVSNFAKSCVTVGFVGIIFVVCLLMMAVEKVREAAEHGHSGIYAVSEAIRNYQSANGHLPPAVVYSDDGRPLYSWRVLILPYIEQAPRFKQFHLDEPWDSPHNLKLMENMPRSFALPKRKQEKLPANHTVVKVMVGKGAAFELGKKLSLDPKANDFTDGAMDTLLLIEAGQPVPWTKPEDFVYNPDGPLPDLRTYLRGGFRTITVDGMGHFVRTGTSEATLRAAITRNGNDKPGPNW